MISKNDNNTEISILLNTISKYYLLVSTTSNTIIQEYK